MSNHFAEFAREVTWMLGPSISQVWEVVGLLGQFVGGFYALLLVLKILRMDSPNTRKPSQNSPVLLSKTLEVLKAYQDRSRRGIARYGAITFTLLLCGGLVIGAVYANDKQASIYNCYARSHKVCWAVARVEGPNSFEFVDLVSGEHREWRFCHDVPVPLYAGYVLSELVVAEGQCDWLGRPDLHYKIVRGKDEHWKESAFYRTTYFDGPDRPVIAHNCHNTPDDSDVLCDGGVAKFERQTASR